MVSSKLKTLRKYLRLKQEEFAEKLKITQAYYSAIERGERPISAKVFDTILNEIGVTRAWFYSSEDPDNLDMLFLSNHIEKTKEQLSSLEKQKREKGLENKKITLESVSERLDIANIELRQLKDLVHGFINNFYKDKLSQKSNSSNADVSRENKKSATNIKEPIESIPMITAALRSSAWDPNQEDFDITEIIKRLEEVASQLKSRENQKDTEGKGLQFYTHADRLADEKKERLKSKKERPT